MTTIGNIGIGLFILIIVWISTLIIFFIAVKTQSNLGWVAIGIALLITLILVLIPVEKINKAEAEEADTSVSSPFIKIKLVGLRTIFICRKRTTVTWDE